MSWSALQWNACVTSLPNPHLLQSWQWGQFKLRYGWQPLPLTWGSETEKPGGAALVLRRTVSPLKLSVLYAPRGPVLDWANPTERAIGLDAVEKLARSQRAIFLKIDPEVILGTGVPGQPGSSESPEAQAVIADLKRRGWRYSDEQVQFANTVIMDLTESEDAWLARLKQKARYNLRLGEKRGVQVRTGTLQDLPNLYKLYAETSVRDGFLIRSQDYYQSLWSLFYLEDMLEPLIAEVDGTVIAAIMVFYFGQRAWYLQGMSRDLHRDKMPNYQLQWAAVRRARERGCTSYDLWGAPDQFDERDPLWGVFRFKEALGGQVVRTIGAWDYPVQPAFYTLYTRVLPQVLNWMRRRGRAQTRQEVMG